MTQESNIDKASSLINRAISMDGFLVFPKSRKNMLEARAILDNGSVPCGTVINGFEGHIALLYIAYPGKSI